MALATWKQGLRIAALAIITSGAAAEEPANTPREASPESGLAIAQRLCVSCHVVEGTDGTVPAGVPALRGIANKKGQTAANIERTLIEPHAPMPNMALTRDEIQDILSYLETLRSDPGVPRLYTPPGEKKPPTPKPS